MRDLRAYSKQTLIGYVFGGIVVIILVAETLIYFYYGKNAAVLGLLCILLGLTPIGLVWIFLWLLELFLKRYSEKQ
jgi:hypothetical protein